MFVQEFMKPMDSVRISSLPLFVKKMQTVLQEPHCVTFQKTAFFIVRLCLCLVLFAFEASCGALKQDCQDRLFRGTFGLWKGGMALPWRMLLNDRTLH
jgi:hypothetical protein